MKQLPSEDRQTGRLLEGQRLVPIGIVSSDTTLRVPKIRYSAHQPVQHSSVVTLPLTDVRIQLFGLCVHAIDDSIPVHSLSLCLAHLHSTLYSGGGKKRVTSPFVNQKITTGRTF